MYKITLYGEVITDYYSDDENLNIVQMDSNSKVIDEVEYEKTNFDIDLYNAYNCSSKYYIFSLKYKLRKIAFKGDYYIIAKYKITGIAESVFVWYNYMRVISMKMHRFMVIQYVMLNILMKVLNIILLLNPLKRIL